METSGNPIDTAMLEYIYSICRFQVLKSKRVDGKGIQEPLVDQMGGKTIHVCNMVKYFNQRAKSAEGKESGRILEITGRKINFRFLR